MQLGFVFLILIINIATIRNQYSYVERVIEDDLSESEKQDYGRLTGDVQNWATIIQNYILQVIHFF